MSEINVPAIGALAARLREERERLKLTQSDLSSRSGVGVSSVSEFETGKREPTLHQLKKIATALETDVGTLLSATPVGAATVRWRQRPADAEAVEARFLRLCRQYRDLEQWAGEEEPVRLRRAERFPLTRSEVVTLAEQVRAELRLGDRPGLALQRKLEDDYAIKTFYLKAPSGCAACTADPELGPAVLLNPLSSAARRTFDLAHELFHLLTWGVRGAPADKEDEERLADQFAAALLLPEEAVRRAVERRIRDGRVSVANMCELARDFAVSVDALIWGLHHLYRWPDFDQTRTLIVTARALMQPYKAVATEPQGEPPELPERYRTLAVQALRSGEISIGRFAEYMGLRRWEAMKYADEISGDETIPLPGV